MIDSSDSMDNESYITLVMRITSFKDGSNQSLPDEKVWRGTPNQSLPDKTFDMELQIQVNTRSPLYIMLGENCCLVHGVYDLWRFSKWSCLMSLKRWSRKHFEYILILHWNLGNQNVKVNKLFKKFERKFLTGRNIKTQDCCLREYLLMAFTWQQDQPSSSVAHGLYFVIWDNHTVDWRCDIILFLMYLNFCM
jgi:hypothetical protein